MKMFNKKIDSNNSNNIISTGAGTSIREKVKMLKNIASVQPKPEQKDKNLPKKIKYSSEFSNKLKENQTFKYNQKQLMTPFFM